MRAFDFNFLNFRHTKMERNLTLVMKTTSYREFYVARWYQCVWIILVSKCDGKSLITKDYYVIGFLAFVNNSGYCLVLYILYFGASAFYQTYFYLYCDVHFWVSVIVMSLICMNAPLLNNTYNPKDSKFKKIKNIQS